MHIWKQFCFCSKQVWQDLSGWLKYKYQVVKVSPGGSSTAAVNASLDVVGMVIGILSVSSTHSLFARPLCPLHVSWPCTLPLWPLPPAFVSYLCTICTLPLHPLCPVFVPFILCLCTSTPFMSLWTSAIYLVKFHCLQHVGLRCPHHLWHKGSQS